jgi:hypothetical protein
MWKAAAVLLLAMACHAQTYHPTSEDRAFLDDLGKRELAFFIEQSDPRTGLVRDRAKTTGVIESAHDRDAASIAATGFGLTALCIGAEHGWIPREAARKQIETTLRFFAEKAPTEHGWFYHFLAADSGERKWKSELSSIDTALLLAGVLTARQCFASDPGIVKMADLIYSRVDFRWMLNGDPHLLAMGWKPESGFIKSRWDHYCEHNILYLLAIASPTHPIPAEAWYAWRRPPITYGRYRYIYGDKPLFVHQYAHAWIDFRGRREPRTQIDWFQNSVTATLAQREYCLHLKSKFPGYSQNIWGLTASDSAKGYVAWGGPPIDGRDDPQIDGTVVPCGPGGSLMFTPAESLAALQEMKRKFGERIYGRYGFTDAFHPRNGWVNPDVIGIDVGITLLSAENLVNGKVWKWFMAYPGMEGALQKVGLARAR